MIRAFDCGMSAAMIVNIAPAAAQLQRRFDLRVPMRDGVELSADVYMPEGPGPYPTVLVRTPYIKANVFDGKMGRM